jgi:transcriptional regulator with XRE-family HTH domain
MDDLVRVGQMIERERKARKLSREQLAALVEVSENTIYRLETGANTTLETFFRTLHALKAQYVASSRANALRQ